MRVFASEGSSAPNTILVLKKKAIFPGCPSRTRHLFIYYALIHLQKGVTAADLTFSGAFIFFRLRVPGPFDGGSAAWDIWREFNLVTIAPFTRSGEMFSSGLCICWRA